MIRDKLEWLPLTLLAIARNKRRSFAMISGIILGVTILSGIFIYTEVLNQQNFESVVNNAAYEVRFDILENETISSLEKISTEIIKADDRILDTTIFAREPSPTQEVQYQTSVVIDGQVEVDRGDLGLGTSTVVPIFVQNNFFDTLIGEAFAKTLSSIPDLSGNSTIISRSFASKNQLELGDSIPELNVTYNKVIFSNNEIDTVKYTDLLTNVRIAGIYEELSSNAGLFGELFAVDEMYFSMDLLDLMGKIKSVIDEEHGYLIASKIDTSKFTVKDPEIMNTEIKQFINSVVKIGEERDIEIKGYNVIEILLTPFQITSFFISIFDFLLAIPVVILSLYLLIFGIEMSLEERRREIAIKKVQGADSKQIFAELRNETLILFIFGLIIGYIFGILGAWIIGSSKGFMVLDFGSGDEFLDFFTIDRTAIIWSLVLVGGILTWQVIKQGKSFIESEVSEGVQKREVKKESFMKKNKVDVIIFIIGVIGIVLSLLEHQFNIKLNLGFFLSLLINGLGPFFLWIGGALVGARISKYVPLKLERIFLSIPSFNDIAIIIKSGLRRRGDTNRLAIIIVLTLSIATMAASQGYTEQLHTQRTLEYEIGSDYQITFSDTGDFMNNITAIDGISDAMAITDSTNFKILNTNFKAKSFDVEKELASLKAGKPIGIWHDDSFPDMTVQEALQKMNDNEYGIFVSEDILDLLLVDIGDTVNMKVYLDGKIDGDVNTLENVKIIGVFDHAPAGISGSRFLISDTLNLRINALAANYSLNAFDGLTLNSSTYIARSTYGYEVSTSQLNTLKKDLAQLNNFNTLRSLYEELNSEATKIGNFGITGLLTLNFMVAVSAALISTFAFSAILMERRKREFAVLRAIGSRKSQIYKLALGENTMLVLTSVIWGSIIGMGITYQFNGVFELFSVFLGGGTLNRIVAIPFGTLITIGLLTTIGMLIATIISVRSAANQDLSTATRVI